MYFTIKQGNTRIIGYHRQIFDIPNYKDITFLWKFFTKIFRQQFCKYKNNPYICNVFLHKEFTTHHLSSKINLIIMTHHRFPPPHP